MNRAWSRTGQRVKCPRCGYLLPVGVKANDCALCAVKDMREQEEQRGDRGIGNPASRILPDRSRSFPVLNRNNSLNTGRLNSSRTRTAQTGPLPFRTQARIKICGIFNSTIGATMPNLDCNLELIDEHDLAVLIGVTLDQRNKKAGAGKAKAGLADFWNALLIMLVDERDRRAKEMRDLNRRGLYTEFDDNESGVLLSDDDKNVD